MNNYFKIHDLLLMHPVVILLKLYYFFVIFYDYFLFTLGKMNPNLRNSLNKGRTLFCFNFIGFYYFLF